MGVCLLVLIPWWAASTEASSSQYKVSKPNSSCSIEEFAKSLIETESLLILTLYSIILLQNTPLFIIYHSTDTSVSDVSIVDAPPYFVDGDQNVNLMCKVTLTHHIGPDYSVLNVTWSYGNTVISRCSYSQLLGKTQQATSIFNCTLILAKVTTERAGLYNCTAHVAGSDTSPGASLSLQVQGLSSIMTDNDSIFASCTCYYYFVQELFKMSPFSYQIIPCLGSH